MKKLIVLIFISAVGAAKAQNYNVMLIPDSLKGNANAVIRNEEYDIVIKSLEEVVIRHKYAITILNENGDEFAEYHNSYNNHEPLRDIDGNLYDASGKKLKNVKRKDIQDEAMDDGFSLMTDARIKSHNFYWKNYPYTIEYKDEKTLDETYAIPSWHPVKDMNCAVQNSNYSIEMPQGFKLRYKLVNYMEEPQAAGGKTKILHWGISNLKAVNYEIFHPPLSKLTPSVWVAPAEFFYEGYQGNMQTWNDLGKFQLDLNKNRDQIPENIKKDIHLLTDNLLTKEEKVNALYQYLQNNSRYVSIQLGIGGFQPFDTKFVAEKKYGDCKALSNYMVALLKEAGIKANYVEIRGGRDVASDYMMEDFPADYFNHIVCCVPNGKDSIWLECTSQTQAAGFMGSFTGNRKALLIDDDGGHVVSTPFYKAGDNVQLRSVQAIIDAEGNMDALVRTTFSGIQGELAHSLIYDANKELRKRYLNQAINLPTYTVEKSNYAELKKKIPMVNEDLHITSPNYASLTGKRLFIKPDIFNKSNRKLSKDSIRLYDICFTSAYRDVDSVFITLPHGYSLEAIPKDLSLNTKFGTYSIGYRIKDNIIEMIRTDERSAATFPASDYNDLFAFYDAIYKADRNQLVFVKKDN